MVNIGNDWDSILRDEFEAEYFLQIEKFIEKEYKEHKIYPPFNEIFNAFKITNYEDVKVVILGQDPYINFGQAHGLAFSVNKNAKIPPSLKNIYKELEQDLQIPIGTHGNLEKWANSGVLLLNTVLTVREKQSNSHKGYWEKFTDNVISILNNKKTPIVFLLWGNKAIEKEKLITNTNHLILKAVHPSPLARGGFFGCKHFSKANNFLVLNGINPIDWNVN